MKIFVMSLSFAGVAVASQPTAGLINKSGVKLGAGLRLPQEEKKISSLMITAAIPSDELQEINGDAAKKAAMTRAIRLITAKCEATAWSREVVSEESKPPVVAYSLITEPDVRVKWKFTGTLAGEKAHRGAIKRKAGRYTVLKRARKVQKGEQIYLREMVPVIEWNGRSAQQNDQH